MDKYMDKYGLYPGYGRLGVCEPTKLSSEKGVTCSQRAGHSAYEDGLARVERLRAVHHEIAVAQVPGADLNLRGADVGVNKENKKYTKSTRS